MKIYDTKLTRVLFTATDRGPSRYALQYIKFNQDGSAEATNGRILVKVFNHHGELEIENDIFIDFEKVTNIPRSGEMELDIQDIKAIGEKNVFTCRYEAPWPAVERIIPSFDAKLSSFTSVNFGAQTLKVLKEVASMDESFAPYWAGKSDNRDGSCILIHDIHNLLVIGLSSDKDDIIEYSSAYKTYLEYHTWKEAEKTESVA